MRAFSLFAATLISTALASPVVNLARQCVPQVASSGTTAQPADPQARMWLALHNAHRANHTNTCSVVWDQQLANEAMISAQQCVFQHTNSGKDYGQNMGEAGAGTAPAAFTSMYYDEVRNFGAYWHQASVPMSEPIVLHFTQAVWKKTTSVGCAINNCGSMYLSYCNYRGPGNYDGEYADNVGDFVASPLPPICSEIGSYGTDGSCITDDQLLQHF
ncbi:hypothetical protein SLS57_009808 [Botryosphaeria dothidea]